MSKIAIFGDTSQDFTQELAREHGIECFFYQIQMDEAHYKDQVDIKSETFYQKLPEHEVLKTGTPAPYDIIEKLEQMRSEGYSDIIMITSSVKLTGMYNLYATHGDSYEGMKLHLIDTENIASGAGLFVIYASRLRAQGLSADEIVCRVKERKDKVSIFALFRTLSYLVRGGRFNKYKGMIGNLLNIMPMLEMRDGMLELKDRYRGKSRSLEALKSVATKEISGYQKYCLVIFSADNQEEVELLKRKMKDEIEGAELFIETQLTPVLGVHSGPGVIGVTIFGLE
ncbi:MAG: DegV family protein [Bacillota bacterium]|nr:DegV family protein [Bacillota bacterium]